MKTFLILALFTCLSAFAYNTEFVEENKINRGVFNGSTNGKPCSLNVYEEEVDGKTVVKFTTKLYREQTFVLTGFHGTYEKFYPFEAKANGFHSSASLSIFYYEDGTPGPYKVISSNGGVIFNCHL